MSRPIYKIAEEIKADWKKVNFAAKPYLDAMLTLTKITDNFINESGESIVRHFICNAGTWRGETAKRIKAELKTMVGLK